MSGFIHVKMTKFYVGCQPTIILLLFPDLGPAVNKIYDTKSKHRHKWSWCGHEIQAPNYAHI